MTRRIWRRPKVSENTGLPPSTLYQKMSNGEFPLPIPLGARSVGWLADEVEEWIETQAKKPRLLSNKKK